MRVYLNDQVGESFFKLYPTNKEAGLSRAVSAFMTMRKITLKEISGIFSKNELTGMLSAFNGTAIDFSIGIPPVEILKAQMEDADIYEHNSSMYQYDLSVLLGKIEQLNNTQALFFIEEMNRFWYENEKNEPSLASFLSQYQTVKMVVSQRLDNDNANEEEEVFSKEVNPQLFSKLKSWHDVEHFLGVKLDTNCIVEIKTYDGEEHLDSLKFNSPNLPVGTFIVLIPHQKEVISFELHSPKSESELYGRYKMWDMHSVMTFASKEEFIKWALEYRGHKSEEVKNLIN